MSAFLSVGLASVPIVSAADIENTVDVSLRVGTRALYELQSLWIEF
jgi:hypothetical protein